MAEAFALQGSDARAVAIIGDGALTGGLTFEGLNNAATSRGRPVLVLNDNQMSISVNVGAVSRMLRGPEARAFFEALGFTYLGPVDGHDLSALDAALREARRSWKPVVVHAHTQKGKGFAAAEADPRTRGHAMGPYEWRDGKLVRSRGGQTTFSETFSSALEQKMAQDPRVVAITPAMLEGSALTQLKARFPDRVFDVGIAEQHAVALAAGMAARGLRPVCALYSTFLQRAYDQLIHDICLPRLPVVFAIDRAGLVGADGATHQGAFDLAFLRCVPNLEIAAPVVGEDMASLLDTALESGRPFALRFPRLTVPVVPDGFPLESGVVRGARWLQRIAHGAELGIITSGPLGLAALSAASGRRWSVLDARFVAPLDEGALLEVARTGRILVMEEGVREGGLGSAVLEVLSEAGIAAKVHRIGLPREFVRHGDAREQRARLGLDVAGIREAAEELLR
jgi:1-deoxy-D-xylulose-5-phosphate synthase